MHVHRSISSHECTRTRGVGIAVPLCFVFGLVAIFEHFSFVVFLTEPRACGISPCWFVGVKSLSNRMVSFKWCVTITDACRFAYRTRMRHLATWFGFSARTGAMRGCTLLSGTGAPGLFSFVSSILVILFISKSSNLSLLFDRTDAKGAERCTLLDIKSKKGNPASPQDPLGVDLSRG